MFVNLPKNQELFKAYNTHDAKNCFLKEHSRYNFQMYDHVIPHAKKSNKITSMNKLKNFRIYPISTKLQSPVE